MMRTGVPHFLRFSASKRRRGAATLVVPYLDSHAALAPVMAGEPRRSFYYTGDMHFNPRG